MKTVATALGLADGASETALLAAVTDLKGKLDASVPKGVHDATVSQLADASAKLAAIETAARAAKVDALIEGALKAKKILPAEREHYTTLCATDAGLDAVAKLFAARDAQLAVSGLDNRKQPDGGGQTAAQLAAAAGKLVAESRARNVELSIADAMTQVQADGLAG